MKKLLALLLTVVLVLTVVPATVFESSAAGSIPLDLDITVRTSPGNWVVNTFTPSETGIYIFSSSGSFDTLGYIALNEGEANNDNIRDDGGQGDNFAVTYKMTAGATYYLGSTVLSENEGATFTYTVKIVKFEVDDQTINPITAGKNTSVSIKQVNGVKFCSFVPSSSGKYVYCSSGNYDTQGYVFDDNWSQIAYTDVGGAVQNFELTLDLQAGKTYYLGYSTNSTATATFNVLVYLKNFISSVSLNTVPDKITYYKGLDATPTSGGKYHVDLLLTNFKFDINYGGGVTETKKYSYAIRSFDCETSREVNAGTNNIRFSYMGYSSTFPINVEDSPVRDFTIIKQPTKTVYYDEDITAAQDVEQTPIFNIRLTGMTLKVEMTDGTEQTFRINSAYGEEIDYFYFDHIIKASDMNLGINTFSFTYYGIEKSFEVNYSLNSDNWQYEIVDSNHVRLTKYTGTDSEAIIPEMLSSLPVTEIGAECFKDNANLTSVRMTERITTIGAQAFYNCLALTELTLPSSLESVGSKAFYGLKGLENLNWNAPNITYSSSDNMFGNLGKNTEQGTTVEFGISCTNIPEYALYSASTSYTPKIYKIIIGESVAFIGNAAFRNLPSLKKVEFNAISVRVNSANNIFTNSGDPSFELEIGEYVESVPANTFYSSSASHCPKMSKVTIRGKDTVFATNSIKNNSAVTNKYYVWYNPDTAGSAYNYVTGLGYDYELLDPKLERLYIYAGAFKTEFVLEEEFSLGDVDVRAVYDNGSQKNVNADLQVSGFDNTSTGTQTVTVSYTSELTTKSLTYQIHMLEKPLVLDYITIATQPDKLEYVSGQSLDLTGVKVNAVFTNGTLQDVSESIITGDYDMNTPGAQTIILSYTYEGVTRTAELNIFIKEPSMTGLRLIVPDEDTDYIAGSILRTGEITVIAEYDDGRKVDVSNYAEYSGYDMSVLGEQTVTVSYNDGDDTKTASFGITVHNWLTKIVLVNLPTQRTYLLGSQFNPEGISVTALREDNKGEDVSALVSYTGYNMNEEGTQNVTVTYTENGVSQTASFQITVKSVSLSAIEITNEPSNAQYQNKPLDTQGLKVMAYYSDSSSKDITQSVDLSGYDMNNYGEQIVYVSYTENGITLRDNFAINVIKQVPASLSITKLPDKTALEVGGTFSATGIEAEVVYNNELTAQLGENDLSFTGYNMLSSGKQTVIVSYTEGSKTISASYEIEVMNRETAVSITSLPSKTRYYIGEELDLSGLIVSATMADGNSVVISNDKLQISGFDNQSEGNQTIAVSYTSPITDKTYNMSFEVNVVSGLKSIAITSQPTKTIFYHSDELDTAGMVVTAYYVDNSNKPVTDKCVLSGYDMNTVGRQTVTVTYTEGSVSKTATYSINVKDYATSIYISNPPSKLNYNLGETLSTASLAVKAHFAVGADRAVTSSVTLSGFESETPGAKTVTVSYNTDKGVLQTTFAVSVYDTVSEFRLISGIGKNFYESGEQLEADDLEAEVMTSAGKLIHIDPGDLTITGYDPYKSGRQILNVSYKYASNETSAQLIVYVDYDDSCDVNGDMFVDLSDVSEILNSGNYSKSAGQATNAKCDVNADGTVNVLDIGEILNRDNYAKAIG